MSFFKKLFGGGSASAEPAGEKTLGEETYKGYLIKAIEMKVGSEYQLAGLIEKGFEDLSLHSCRPHELGGRPRFAGPGQGPPDHRRAGRRHFPLIARTPVRIDREPSRLAVRF